jgi:AraC family transcriptional regulator of adaptative response / DNA-3-methyladenine glycosylase II
LILPYRPPFDWQALVDFMALRATPGVERIDAAGYVRTFRCAGSRGRVRVRPVAGAHRLVASIHLTDPLALVDLHERLRRVFDLGADPLAISAELGRDPLLGPRVAARPGLRIPGAWDGFELAVRAVLGQQVTVKGATTLAGRLAEAFGEPLHEQSEANARSEDPSRLFPEPAALVEADLKRIGLPGARAAAIRALARAVDDGELDLDPSSDPAETARALTALPGIGAWTAEYIAMRGLGAPDAFPASDLGLRRVFGSPARPLGSRALLALAERWRPWRAYAAMYAWQIPAPKVASGRRPVDTQPMRVVHGSG